MVLFLHYSPIILILLVYVTICFTQELSGHVCPYQITGVRSEETLGTTFSYECQCEVRSTVLVDVPYTETVNRCCRGWIQTGNNCSILCTDNTFGRNCSETCNCTSVNSYCSPFRGCLCMAGWKEPNCSSPCDPGSHSFACRKNCTCLNNASCDPISGSCNCTPGWIGSYCNITCPAGRYGNYCHEKCTCMDGAVCDPVNGRCSCLPDGIGPNCTLREDTTTHQTKVKQESNHFGSDSTARLILIVVSVVGGVAIIIAIVGGALWYISNNYRGSMKVRASTSGLNQETNGRGKNRGATQSRLQTPESGALLVSTESSQKPECTTSTENADVKHMYETTITQSDDRTRNPLEEAPSRVPLPTANTLLTDGESAYCDVEEVKTPLQVIAVHNTHAGEIEHTYYQRNTHL